MIKFRYKGNNMKKKNMIIIGLTILVAGGIFVGFMAKNKNEENNKIYQIKYLNFHYDGGMENTYYMLTYYDTEAIIEEDQDSEIKQHKIDVEKLNSEVSKFINKYDIWNWTHKENEYEVLDASTSTIIIECEDGLKFILSDSEYIPQNKLSIMNDFKEAMKSSYK